jgi:hypothetical protein
MGASWCGCGFGWRVDARRCGCGYGVPGVARAGARVRVRGDARRCGCGNGCAQVTPQVWYAGVGVGAQV